MTELTSKTGIWTGKGLMRYEAAPNFWLKKTQTVYPLKKVDIFPSRESSMCQTLNFMKVRNIYSSNQNWIATNKNIKPPPNSTATFFKMKNISWLSVIQKHSISFFKIITGNLLYKLINYSAWFKQASKYMKEIILI